jgi:hypothetical protein
MAALAAEAISLSKSGELRSFCLRACRMDYSMLNISEELVNL